MPTDPLTASRYPASSAAPNVPQDIQNAVSDLSINTTPRFATTAARDAAYTAYTNAGGVLANGRSCWTDDSGYWDRVGGSWVARITVSGGNLSLIGGWSVLANYHQPAYELTSTGWYTLSGAVLRTAAGFALGSGTAYQFATLPVAPASSISPICFIGLDSSNPSQTYPARLYCPGGSTALSIVGMGSGSGTLAQNLGYISLDSVKFRT